MSAERLQQQRTPKQHNSAHQKQHNSAHQKQHNSAHQNNTIAHTKSSSSHYTANPPTLSAGWQDIQVHCPISKDSSATALVTLKGKATDSVSSLLQQLHQVHPTANAGFMVFEGERLDGSCTVEAAGIYSGAVLFTQSHTDMSSTSHSSLSTGGLRTMSLSPPPFEQTLAHNRSDLHSRASNDQLQCTNR